MSEATETPTVPTLEVGGKNPSFFNRRIVTPIKNHPKIALAILGGLVLVGAAALVAKNEDDNPSTETDSDEDLVADTTVA